MKSFYRLDSNFITACLNIDPDYEFDHDGFCELLQNSSFEKGVFSEDKDIDRCYVGEEADSFFEKDESKNSFYMPILTFNNLKLLKSILQKNGNKTAKEAILTIIKKYKNGEYECNDDSF